MAAALIGEAFLSASIKVLCDGITSTEFIDLFWCKKLDESLLVKLKITLLALYAVLSDAEKKQIVNPAVEGEDQSDKLTSKVWNFFSTSHNSFYLNMNGRIKELFQRLEQLATEKDVFGLREVHGVKVSIELQQPPWLMSVMVGKTALAQILYNDDKVKEHFALRAWACVSEDYDAIREQIRGKKFLFVLDDLWNVKYLDWECFRIPFTSGARRSKVIVTSRSTNVASIKQNVPIHKLKPLFNEGTTAS
ncbi:putative disease resistance RPP13-like protein 1 [Malus domestica]|uniref:putative disease resistance RPP13-like protein 1 n=1 Tax=Malus domestica TaxID=3750 RepID=UPI003975A277